VSGNNKKCCIFYPVIFEKESGIKTTHKNDSIMKMRFLKYSVLLFILNLCYSVTSGQDAPKTVVAGIPVNYYEALVGTYVLPDPLVSLDGKAVKNARTWYQSRRPEILRLVEENEYGRSPERPKEMTFNVFDKGTSVFEGISRVHWAVVKFEKSSMIKPI